MKRIIIAFLALAIGFALPAMAQKDNTATSDPISSEYPCNQQGDSGLCLPLDATWEVVEFTNGAADCFENDDGSSVLMPSGFAFDLFGSPQTDCYINNNGNISFGAPYSTYSPEGFPIADFPMVAPFWGDVDTRSLLDNAGVVWWTSGPGWFAVTWDHVGYYSSHTDLQNTFQLIISDGSAGTPTGEGNNVCFCYGDMSWTTGDASGAQVVSAGSPATVGVNKGDGIDYFNIGRFDHPGGDYAGPDGISGVDWLDGLNTCFAVGGETNQCPVALNFPPGNTITLTEDMPAMNLTVSFIGPEANQTVFVTVDDGGLANFTANVTNGNPATVEMTFTPDELQIGVHVINFIAVDDFDPPCTTQTSLTIVVEQSVPVEGIPWGNLKSTWR